MLKLFKRQKTVTINVIGQKDGISELEPLIDIANESFDLEKQSEDKFYILTTPNRVTVRDYKDRFEGSNCVGDISILVYFPTEQFAWIAIDTFGFNNLLNLRRYAKQVPISQL